MQPKLKLPLGFGFRHISVSSSELSQVHLQGSSWQGRIYNCFVVVKYYLTSAVVTATAPHTRLELNEPLVHGLQQGWVHLLHYVFQLVRV